MSDIRLANLTDELFPEWCDYVTAFYGPAHVLTDRAHLRWFYGGLGVGAPVQKYETVVAIDGNGRIVGSYGALNSPLRIDRKAYSFCWYVSGGVLPDFRGQGIAGQFIEFLLARFDICGLLSFTTAVRKNYDRAGFNLFGNGSLRKFIKVLKPDAFELVTALNGELEKARDLFPISPITKLCTDQVSQIENFDESILEASQAMSEVVRVGVEKSSAYLNWRYTKNPRIKYEISVNERVPHAAYLVSRRERFMPTKVFGNRILDLAGLPAQVKSILDVEIQKSVDRGDCLVEVSFTGSYYEKLMQSSGFVEVPDEAYQWWPSTSSPIERRENHEYIGLGSRKYSAVVNSLSYDETFFTRGDSDRDRASGLL